VFCFREGWIEGYGRGLQDADGEGGYGIGGFDTAAVFIGDDYVVGCPVNLADDSI